MTAKPPNIRNILNISEFSQSYSGDWLLCLEDYYARLFEDQHPMLAQKANFSWRPSKKGNGSVFTYLHNLEADDIATIQDFVEVYSSKLIIGISPHLEPHFKDELDVCIALDRHYAGGSRTVIGQLEYEAKYQESTEAAIKLVEYYLEGMQCARRFLSNRVACLSYIPVAQNKVYDLPRLIANQLALRLGSGFFNTRLPSLVDSTLTIPKRALKNATLQEKIEEWNRLIAAKAIQLARPIKGKVVFLIDDLYESGTTLWSIAKYLKSIGAEAVFAVVSTKTRSDTDNSGSNPSLKTPHWSSSDTNSEDDSWDTTIDLPF